MIFPLFRRNGRDPSIDRLYGAIVAQARVPALYRDFGVADTMEGRLEMLMLHAILVLQRLRGEGPALKAAGQQVFDRFCLDMDDSLREMGVGDLAVPRRMQRIAGSFYGRAKVYEAALAAGDEAGLVEALQRNIYDDRPDAAAAAEALAVYVRSAVQHLERLDSATLASGEVSFPHPARI